MEINLVAEGMKFMFLGMVTVFLFLILMVYVLHLQAKIINKFFPPKEASPLIKPSKSVQSVQDGNSAKVAAIVAAIMTHKNKIAKKG